MWKLPLGPGLSGKGLQLRWRRFKVQFYATTTTIKKKKTKTKTKNKCSNFSTHVMEELINTWTTLKVKLEDYSIGRKKYNYYKSTSNQEYGQPDDWAGRLNQRCLTSPRGWWRWFFLFKGWKGGKDFSLGWIRETGWSLLSDCFELH